MNSDADRFILTAADIVKLKLARGDIPRVAPPRNVILCFQRALVAYALRKHRGRKVNGFFGDVHILNETKGPTAMVGNVGIGAPVAVALLEELVAFGVRRFVAIGLAGGLQPGLCAGDLVVCDRAVRAEGTSHHYLPLEQFAFANTEITQTLLRALESRKQKCTLGASWTTDAPYRESRRQVEQYQHEGIVTVEMEAAALFAAGQALGVQVGAAFAIADSLVGVEWKLDFDHQRAQQGLQRLFDATLEIFSETR